MLAGLGGADYVLNAPRTSLVAANKEGLASLPGYLALCLLGQGLGRYLLAAKTPAEWHGAVSRLIAISLVAGAFISVAASLWGMPPSRRMSNAAYVAWVVGASTLALAILLASALCIPGTPQLILVRAVNANQLPLFLLVCLFIGSKTATIDGCRKNS